MKKLIICFDGTWNNPYQMKERDDGSNVLKPSNPLKMARAILPWDATEQQQQITYYDSGVGALAKYPGVSNRVLGLVDNMLGGGWGAGFEANIEQAVTFLVNNYNEGDELFVFGFSRGSAQARGLTHFIDWMGGIPSKSDAYFVPLYFHSYISSAGEGNPTQVTTAGGAAPDKDIKPIQIKFLGVWETVMALGSRFLAKKGTSVVKRSFHVGEKPAKCVKNARQALAIDEKRYDFRPEIWMDHDEHQTLEQRWFTGVHSNIGGGYVHDGLANIAFRWLLREAEAYELAVDHDFSKHYRPYPQAQFYESQTITYKVMEFIRLKRKSGHRKLIGYPDTANLVLDKAVIHRMRADPMKYKQMKELYRPANVIELLGEHKANLTEYLASLGLDEEDAVLPQDVLEELSCSY